MQFSNIFDVLNSHILSFKEKYICLFYTIYVISTIIFIIIFYYLQLKFTHYKIKSKKIKLLQILVDSFFLPMILFFSLQMLSDMNNFFLKYLDASIFFIINKFKSISFVWMSWLGFARLIKNIEKTLVEDGVFKRTNDTTIIVTISKTLTIFVYIIMGVMLMKIFGFHFSKVLAIIGGPAAIMIFAGKTAISDFLGGISILMNKSFSINEEIVIPEKNIEGKILKIGLKKMTLITVDRDIITIPNSMLANVSIINKTKTQLKQIRIEIPIEKQYFNLIDKITEKIKKMLYTCQEINKIYKILVFCNKINTAGSFIIEEIFYVKLTNIEKYKKIQQDCLLISIKIIDEIIKNETNF